MCLTRGLMALVSDRYPLRDWPVPVEMAMRQGEEIWKILIYPSEEWGKVVAVN